jgi:hypothetical protein
LCSTEMVIYIMDGSNHWLKLPEKQALNFKLLCPT